MVVEYPHRWLFLQVEAGISDIYHVDQERR